MLTQLETRFAAFTNIYSLFLGSVQIWAAKKNCDFCLHCHCCFVVVK